MNLGVSTHNYIGVGRGGESTPYLGQQNVVDLVEVVEGIVADGFGVELWLEWDPDKEAVARDRDQLKVLLEGSRLSAHSKDVLDQGEWDYAEFKREIDLCSYLGAGILVAHPWDSATHLKSCRKVVDYASGKNVTMALENGSSSRFLSVTEDVEGLGICIDLGHANLDEEYEDAAGVIEQFKDRVVHFHFADNHGERDEHLVPGEGKIGWRKIVGVISGFDGLCVLELNTKDPRRGALRGREFLYRLEAEESEVEL